MRAPICNNNHLMYFLTYEQLNELNSNYADGAICDKCGNSVGGDDVFHCNLCDYDLCRNCARSKSNNINWPNNCGNREREFHDCVR